MTVLQIYFQLIAPGEPRGVTAKLQSDGSIRVEWKEPEVLNGKIISYQVCSMLSKTQSIETIDAFPIHFTTHLVA